MTNPTVHEAALLLGGSDAWVRSACDRGLIGDAWGTGHYRKTYVVVPAKIAQFLGITEDEVIFRLHKIREDNNGLYR